MAFKISLLVQFVAVFFLLVILKVSTANGPCPLGYTGSNCTVDIDDCVNVTCSGSGNCSDRLDGYFCFCFTGFYGTNCEIDADQCNPNPCKNNGHCTKEGSLFKCNCTADYEGTKCESEKPSRIFSVSLNLINRTYSSDFADLKKPRTRAIIADLTDIFGTFFRERFMEQFRGINFRGFYSVGGLVGTNFELTFGPTSNVSSSSIIQALEKGSTTKDLRFEFIEKITVVQGKFEDSTVITSTSDSGSKLANWILVLIIAGVIFIILLLLLIILLLYYRHKHMKENELVANNGNWDLAMFRQK